jgi:hypothetical protein
MILIAGDSYCAFTDEGTWPQVLSKNLGMDIIHCSHSGGSWWATRRSLLKLDLSKIKIAIFCHTEGSRIPNIDDYPIGGWIVEHSNWLPKEISEAAKMYYQYLHDPDFGVWTQQKWIDDCESLFSDDALIVHMHSFVYTMKKIKINKGIEIFPPLETLTWGEFESVDEGFKFIKNGDPRKNHLSTENNLILGQELTRIINNHKEGTISLDLSKFTSLNSNSLSEVLSGCGDIIFNNKVI